MAIQRIEIDLSKSVYQQLARITEEAAKPIAPIAAQGVVSNLSSSVEYALPGLRVKLLELQTLAMA